MTNITTTAKGGASTGNTSVGQAPVIVTHEINIADIAATVTTGGYATIVNIPDNTYFQFLQAECVTTVSLDASSSRVDIGDVADDDQFVSNASTLTAGTVLTIATPTGSPGLVYDTTEAIRLKLTGDKMAGGTANATGIIRFSWLQGNCNRNAKAVAS